MAALVWAAALAIVGSTAEGAGVDDAKFEVLAANAKWSGATFAWYYAPAGQPTWADATKMAALIEQAMNAWSSRCGVRFQYLGTTAAAPTAQDSASVFGWVPSLAYASTTSWYVRDGSLSEADIELNVGANGSAAAAYPIILHEVGHAIGLAHSPVQQSVMAGPPAATYSYAEELQPDDVTGCQALYGPPQGPPVRAQAAPSVPGADAVAVEYYHPRLDHYFMTASRNEQASLANGGPDGQWQRTGVTFPVWSLGSPLLQPMCRFYGDWHVDPNTGKRIGPDSHFYTANPAECGIVPERWPVWIFEGSTFFAALPDTSGTCPAGTQAVSRFFKPQGDPNHRYVTSEALKQEMSARGWVAEGVAWCAGT